MNEGYGVESKVATVKRCTTTGTGLVAPNKIILKTIGKMRLYASNDGSTGIDTIPSDVMLIVQEIQVRNNSSSVYYVRVKSVDGKYKGWVSLGSIHYDLYVRGEKVTTCTYKDDCGNTWITDDPLPLFDPNTKEIVMKDLKGGTNAISYSPYGITYEF